MNFDPELHPHRRLNALTGEWVLVSPHRALRPWQGAVEPGAPEDRPSYDEKCYLCPGNRRVGDSVNPPYAEPFVFTNDFQAILPEVPLESPGQEGLLQCQPVQGTCRVICFSPRHDLTLPEMEVDDIRKVVDVWAGQVTELGARYRWVQVFENKGAIMGCSNPHPHGQVWASNFLPRLVEPEDTCQRRHARESGGTLLLDYLQPELAAGKRVIDQNEHWVMLVPYWATWPFELLLIPRRHVLRLPDLGADERHSLARILKLSLTRYDNLFQTSFPYSMGWHGAPHGEDSQEHWQLHAHFYPPLLRSATVKKFMVGYEMLAEPQRDLTPEQAARRLADVSTVHYRQGLADEADEA
jgi:UDPglucose--hexose-1-phosphate uridylyltransferase